MRSKVLAGLLVAIGGFAGNAEAITITNTGSNWVDVLPSGGDCTPSTGLPCVTNRDGLLTDTIVWGMNSEDGTASSYDFTPTNAEVTSLETDFVLGTFTHNNNRIGSLNEALDSAVLQAQYQIDINGTVDTIDIEFAFSHDETQNNQAVCPYGGTNPCSDGIFVNTVSQTYYYSINGENYFLEVLGLIPAIGEWSTTFMQSAENASTSAYIVARTGKFSAVPEPATLALLGAGALGALKRRRK